ncbi:YpbS family protein [Bacillus sinesaloumensis]|uniref:YpbS family protein n=1 Tax=Litchfieldia sinesaloumensis TaxID=1926280 RepID=UPI0009886CFB|nr:YpbS family protein [Bacillus sinesaloumensis]
MTNVHEAITKHSNGQHAVVKRFVGLEQQRELFIEEAVTLAKQNKEFTVDKINRVTNEMNQLAQKGIVPLRRLVTVEMVKEYAGRN